MKTTRIGLSKRQLGPDCFGVALATAAALVCKAQAVASVLGFSGVGAVVFGVVLSRLEGAFELGPTNLAATITAVRIGGARAAAPRHHGRTSDSVLEQMDAAHPQEPHWYLPWLGVDSALQGTGRGAQLLGHGLARVDADRLPAFLETPNPRTVPFYERHGFVVSSVSQAGACPPVSSMWRPAR
jgi:GNAT superfamily N-acetyltransferase